MATNTTATTQNHNGNGSTATFAISFSFLENTEVDVTVGGVLKTLGTHYNISGSSVTFTSGNIPPSGTNNIKFQRDTNISTKKVDFADGSVLTETDLDNNSDQILFAQQEITDKLDGIEEGATGDQTVSEIKSLIAGSPLDASHLAANSVNTSELANDSVSNAKIIAASVGTRELATGGVTTAKIADSAVTTAKLANDSVSNAKIIAGSVGTRELNTSGVTTAKIGDSQVTTAKIAADAVTDLKIADNAVRTEHIHQNAITSVKIANDAVTNAKIADDSIDSEHYVDGSIDAAHIATGAITTPKIADNDVTTLKLSNDAVTAPKLAANAVVTASIVDSNVTTPKIADNAVTTGKIADAELKTLAGMQSATASKLADSTALTSDLADLNQLDGMAKQTTITNDDTKFPTSGAVVDFVAAQIAPLGGLEVVATDAAFPNTQPSSGVVISISDAGGVAFNGSGTSTTARTVGGSTVTINNAPSSLNNETLAAGVGLMVSSTGSGQIYNYHKILGKEDDIKQLSDDINDFKARYRVVSSNPTSNNDAGDLIFNTSTQKLLVFNSTSNAFEEAQSVGNFFISTLSPAFNGSLQDFTITNAPSNAQQIILSINGVIQKPNSGTSTPSEGFALSGNTVKLAAAPASGSDYFAIVLGSTVNIGTPSNNTVTTAILQNGSVTNDKVNASAAIAGTKISPNFGSQNIITTGTLGSGNFTITGTAPSLFFTESDANPDYQLLSNGGVFKLHDVTNSKDRLSIDSSGIIYVGGIGASATAGTLFFNDTSANGSKIAQVNGSSALSFHTGSSQPERLRIDSSGRVGIGTTSPSYKLEVSAETAISGDVRFLTGSRHKFIGGGSGNNLELGTYSSNNTSRNIGLVIDSSGILLAGSTSTANNARIQGFIAHGSTAGESGITSVDTTAVAAGVGGEISFYGKSNSSGNYSYFGHIRGIKENATSGNTACALTFHTRPTLTAPQERMRITSSGSVGIGTTSPSAHLAVEGNGNECLRLKNTTGIINRIIFQDNASRQAEIIMHTGHLQFSPNSGGSIRFQLNENGQGNHNYTTNCNPKEIYNWSNNKTGMSFRSASTERGNIFFFDSGVQFNTSSDYRLKENVTTISDGITRIKQLIPRKFNWIIDESNTPVDGFLAHEVSSIVPEAINGTKDAVATQEDVDSGRSQKVGDPIHQMIDHSKLVPLLTAALQEAIVKIEVLQTKVAALEAA